MEATLLRDGAMQQVGMILSEGVVMKTGTDVTRSGMYATECCLVETELNKDQSFPRCPKCMGLTLWASVRITASEKPPKAA
jgi:hypothetical protein